MREERESQTEWGGKAAASGKERGGQRVQWERWMADEGPSRMDRCIG